MQNLYFSLFSVDYNTEQQGEQISELMRRE